MKNHVIKQSALATVILLSLLIFTPLSTVQAANKYWSYTSCGNSWWDTNCWSATFLGPLDGTSQPLDGDNVYLYNSSSSDYQVAYWNTLYPAAVLNSFSINATGTGSMTLYYANSNNLTTLTETIGDTGSGVLNQSSGTHSVTNDLILGNTATGNGNFTLSNVGTLSAGNITVGNAGTGVFAQSGGTNTVSGDLYLGSASTGFGSYDLSGTGTLSVDNITVGNDGEGEMTISSGGTASSNIFGYIGRNNNSTGTVTVTGAGSSLFASSLLYVGYDGTGILNIENGGEATRVTLGTGVNGHGTVTVSGAGSSLNQSSTVGGAGTGILNINSGGTASGFSAHLGSSSTGHGTATVDGIGSNWTLTEDMVVGNAGTGILNITNGGSVTNVDGYIGDSVGSNGTVLVSGIGSSWNNSGTVSIGNTGILNIENGGSVQSDNSFLGRAAGSQGSATISGVGASWSNTTNFTIGGSGIGTLNIENAGLATVTEISLGSHATGNGGLTVSNASLTNTGDFYIGVEGTGTLSVLNGGSVSSQDVIIGAGYRTDICGIFCLETNFYTGNGAVTVDGVGSAWDIGGELSFLNDGILNIQNGGSVTSDSAIIGDFNIDFSYGTGHVTVDGIGSTWVNNNDIVMHSVSSFNISNGGSVTSDRIFGNVNIISGGSLNVRDFTGGNTAVAGASSNMNGDYLDVDYLDITSGGTINTYVQARVNSSATIDGAGSELSASQFASSGSLFVDNGGSVISDVFGALVFLDVINGSSLTSSTSGFAGIALIDGAGSSWNSGGLGADSLTISNGGTVNSSSADVVSAVIDGVASTWTDTGSMTLGSITISDGGAVISSDVTVGVDVNMSGTNLLNEGVSWDIAGSLTVNGLLYLGEYANVNVANTTTINSIEIDGGHLVTGQLSGSMAGSLFNAGTLTVTNPGPAVDISGATLGNAVGGSFSMVLPQDTQINYGSTLALHNNSSLTTDTLINDGVVSGYGSVNGMVNGGTHSAFVASGGDLALGDTNSFNGFRTQGLIDIGAETVTLNSKQKAQLGYQTQLNGGILTAANGVFLSGASVIVGNGDVNANIAAQTGSTIYATGNLSLGDVNKFDGFYSQGNMSINEFVVTINDKNEAVLGSLTTLGNITGAGTLQSSNGLLLQQGSNLVGYGTVNGDFINQGHVEETSAPSADYIEFTGNVSGAGDYAGNILFSGTFTPGNSPALVSFEDIAFGLDSILTMEIGGVFAGSQYDVLEGIAGSTATLAGTLDVDLYDLGGGLFGPSLGDTFDILKAEVITGEFDLLMLAVLSEGLGWQLDYLTDEIGSIDIARLSVVSASTVPVPAAVWLLGSGLLGIVVVARRKKQA